MTRLSRYRELRNIFDEFTDWLGKEYPLGIQDWDGIEPNYLLKLDYEKKQVTMELWKGVAPISFSIEEATRLAGNLITCVGTMVDNLKEKEES